MKPSIVAEKPNVVEQHDPRISKVMIHIPDVAKPKEGEKDISDDEKTVFQEDVADEEEEEEEEEFEEENEEVVDKEKDEVVEKEKDEVVEEQVAKGVSHAPAPFGKVVANDDVGNGEYTYPDSQFMQQQQQQQQTTWYQPHCTTYHQHFFEENKRLLQENAELREELRSTVQFYQDQLSYITGFYQAQNEYLLSLMHNRK
jgi:hypothetical protein